MHIHQDCIELIFSFLPPKHKLLKSVRLVNKDFLTASKVFFKNYFFKYIQRAEHSHIMQHFLNLYINHPLGLNAKIDNFVSNNLYFIEKFYLDKLVATLIDSANASGYVTINSARGKCNFINFKAGLQNFHHVPSMLTELNCTDYNLAQIETIPSEIRTWIKFNFKQPSDWLCSYERPRKKRIMCGCLKKIFQIMHHTHRYGPLTLYRYSKSIYSLDICYVFINHVFCIGFAWHYC